MASAPESSAPATGTPATSTRRGATATMCAGLAAGYGLFAWIAGRFLFPARDPAKGFMFVTEVDRVPVGEAIVFRTPAGESVNIARQGTSGTADDFIALSSTCPHLGCQVHWVPKDRQFFCPCHNGVFDAAGAPLAGPPHASNLSLVRYPLKVEKGLLYIEVPLAVLALGDGEVTAPCACTGPGVDPCLYPQHPRADRARLG